ncbi:MAG: AAA family ATPase, partial [Gammaproteobacteria bacterium]
MYEEFYGLRTNPFTLLPAPEFLYESRKHALGVSLLEYAVERRLLLSVITGEVGSGKTTIVRRLLNGLGDDVTVGLISNTHAAFGNLMQWVALAFDLPFKGRDKVELYHDFVEFLIEQYRQGRRTLLVVDEAQNLDVETLEELRLLTNVNADDHHVLQTLLVGQPELHDKLKQHDLRQLAQRISVSHRVEPLDEAETTAYVRHRLKVAGGDPRIFHKNALRLIHRNSGGIPRIINTLCDQALVYGYADGKRQIDALLIADIARDRIDTGLYGEVVHDVSSLGETNAGATPAMVEADPGCDAAAGAPAASHGTDETVEIGA